MGRRRKTEHHLPRRLYLDHGTYWFRPKGAKPQNLGRDLAEALGAYGRIVGPAMPARTVAEVIHRYTIEVLPGKRSAHVRRDQAAQLDRLRKVFGAMLPDSITAQHCYRYLDARRGPDGQPVPVAARHEVALLGHVLQQAIRWGVASANPVRSVDFGARSPKRAAVPLEQVERLRALAPERIRVAIDLAVCMGPRRGDLLGLRRANLTAEGIEFLNSKTQARQLIEWSDDLHRIVDRAKALAPQVPGDYLIRTRRGQAYTADGFSAIWQRVMRKHVAAGGQRFSFHDLRAVSADGAASAEEARDRLGHADVATTRRHYLRGVVRGKPRT